MNFVRKVLLLLSINLYLTSGLETTQTTDAGQTLPTSGSSHLNEQMTSFRTVVTTIQNNVNSFFEQMISAVKRSASSDRNESFSGESTFDDSNLRKNGKPNQASSAGANSVGFNEGDVPHPPGASGRPTGVEPPRPESKPDPHSVGKIPSSVTNQTASIATNAGSGSGFSFLRLFG